MNIIDKLYCDLKNKYEEFTHWYWNRKPYHVTCKICNETIKSREAYYNGSSLSPEECGWRQLKFGGWICHSCDAHRNYTPYVKLVDLDEKIAWCDNEDDKKVLKRFREKVLDALKNVEVF